MSPVCPVPLAGPLRREWTDTDDLVQVAGLRADQRDALRANGIHTMAALAAARLEDVSAVLSTATAERLHQQATLGWPSVKRPRGIPFSCPRRSAAGCSACPSPAPATSTSTSRAIPGPTRAAAEYLAGLWDRNGAFTEFWARDTAGEKRLTEDLLDELMRRWQADPGMHVYHYAPYERTALERLTGRHGTREAELDQLLRGERLVDLYAVVRQGLRISKPSYSIKKLEGFYWGLRAAAARGRRVGRDDLGRRVRAVADRA